VSIDIVHSKQVIFIKFLKNVYFLFLIESFPDKKWVDPQFHDDEKTQIKKPDELENEMEDPPGPIDPQLLDKVQGSMIGMAIGDALGAHVEFRPYEYVKANPVTKMEGGGTWGLKEGQVVKFEINF